MTASIAAVIATNDGMKPSADGITRTTSASAQDEEPLVRSDYDAIIGRIAAMIATTDGMIAIISGMIEAADGLVADGRQCNVCMNSIPPTPLPRQRVFP